MALHILSHGILVQTHTVLSTHKLLQGLAKVIDTFDLDIQDQVDIIG
jgi:hypothetical protein